MDRGPSVNMEKRLAEKRPMVSQGVEYVEDVDASFLEDLSQYENEEFEDFDYYRDVEESK